MDNPFMQPATQLQTRLLHNLITHLTLFGGLMMQGFAIQVDALPNPVEVVIKGMSFTETVDGLCSMIVDYPDTDDDDKIVVDLFWKVAFKVQEEILPKVKELESIAGYNAPKIDGEPFSKVLSGWLATAAN